MNKIDDLLATEGAAAENHEVPEELPEHVRVSRPNFGRSTVVSVRFSEDEHAQLQQAAADANLPVSTLIRAWALDRIEGPSEFTLKSAMIGEIEAHGLTMVAKRLDRLEEQVFHRKS